MIRLTLAALRNYASPVFARENFLVVNVILFIAIQPIIWWQVNREVARHGLRAALTTGGPLIFPWWILAYFLAASVVFHFSRQARANISPSIPRFIAAERSAASLILLLALGALCAPLWLIGAPAVGAVALSAGGMLMGGITGIFGNSGASKRARGIAALLYLPVMILGLTPRGLTTILFLPLPLTIILALGFTSALLLSLVYRPAHAAAQEAEGDAAADRRAGRMATRHTQPNQVVSNILLFLAWRPAFMSLSPLPSLFGQPAGVAATALAILAQIILFVAVTTGGEVIVEYHSLAQALPHSGPQALAYAPLIGNFTSINWLLARGDWPYLFSAGLYGPRASFAQALFRAHRQKTMLQALLAAPMVTAAAVALKLISPSHAPALLIIILGFSAGGAYAGAIPLMFNELGGKALSGTCTLVATMGGVFAVSFVLRNHILIPALFAALAALALAVWLDRLAPRRLAALDWPIETEAELG